MLTKLLAVNIALIVLLLTPRAVNAPEANYEAVERQIKERDALRAFLKSYGSSEVAMDNRLANCFVVQSSRFGFDSSLLPCIAKAESSVGKFYIRKTNNIWGFGHGLIAFDSFCAGVVEVGKTIATDKVYKAWQEDKGNLWKLAYVFKGVPPYEKWVYTVKECMEEIEKNEKRPRTKI